MQRIKLHRSLTSVLLFTGILASGPALAEKPAWAGSGKADKHGQDNQNEGNQGNGGDHGNKADHDDNSNHDGNAPGVSVHFDDQQRTRIHDYYGEQVRAGHCPPGLAKKNNGCMPPGQAKKWTIGQVLPRDVIFYDLSPEILVHLGPPPSTYRYVRVANDILMIAIGTGMVVDAIQDLTGN